MAKNLKISVAMAIYNPNCYFVDQIMSISKQTLPPDELIICDDSPTSKAQSTAQEILKRSGISLIYIHNHNRLGLIKNFEKAIQNCSGDLIFLSDQDDVWLPNKIKFIADIYINHKFLLCIHDAIPTDENLNHLSVDSLANHAMKGENKINNFIFGCCTAISSELAKIALPFSKQAVGLNSHDGSLHYISGLLGGKIFIPNKLMYYRRHSNATSKQDISINKTESFASKIKSLIDRIFKQSKIVNSNISIRLQAELDYLKDLNIRVSESPNNLKFIISQRLVYVQKRLAIRDSDRLSKIFKVSTYYFQGGYKNFSNLKSAAMDILL